MKIGMKFELVDSKEVNPYTESAFTYVKKKRGFYYNAHYNYYIFTKENMFGSWHLLSGDGERFCNRIRFKENGYEVRTVNGVSCCDISLANEFERGEISYKQLVELMRRRCS